MLDFFGDLLYNGVNIFNNKEMRMWDLLDF